MITNNGRLPITIVDVYDKVAKEHHLQTSFSWTSFSGQETFQDVPATLGVGEAIAVRVITEGRSQSTPLHVTLNDGSQQELNLADPDGGRPVSVESAFERLPSCNTSE
ncbi:hypothetical protein FB468_2330 [Leucobacter komagatae]|uniref:Uncharacterized protein n=1 Tax=Leucobacter komagatae TaxID=55969 RepID=A0A542Y854_9MICO|nr:hypothetical protein FB468_2330 [Leucobacter komagatae]